MGKKIFDLVYALSGTITPNLPAGADKRWSNDARIELISPASQCQQRYETVSMHCGESLEEKMKGGIAPSVMGS